MILCSLPSNKKNEDENTDNMTHFIIFINVQINFEIGKNAGRENNNNNFLI